jgi:hypothetical protein
MKMHDPAFILVDALASGNVTAKTKKGPGSLPMVTE